MAKSFVDILIRAKDVASGAVGKVNKSLGSLSDSSQKLDSTFSVLRKHWLAISASMIAVAVPLKKVVGDFKGFETALVDMGKVTDESLSTIKQRIMELPPKIGSATEMMEGYYQVISAGVTEPKKALETLIVASKAAKASHTAQSEVIKGLTKMMAGFEGEIKDVTEASDLLFTIEKEGQTTFQEMIPVIGGLAKMSRDLGVSSDEMGASLATITQTAGSTAEAATQYRAILVALSKSQKVARVITEELGYAGIEAAISQEGLAGVLEELRDTVGGSAEAMSDLLGRQEAMLGVSALGAKNFETVNKKLAVMQEKTGATDKAFVAWEKTLDGIWDTFKNTVGRIAIEIGTKIAPAIKTGLKNIEKYSDDVLEAFESLWKVLTAFPVGVIEYFKNLRGEIDKTKDKVNELKNELLEPSPWQKFITFLSQWGFDIIDIFVYVSKVVGETLALLIVDAITVFDGLKDVLKPIGDMIIGIVTLDKSRIKKSWGKWTDVAYETVDKLKINWDAYIKSVGESYDTMIENMIKTRIPDLVEPIEKNTEAVEIAADKVKKIREEEIKDLKAYLDKQTAAEEKKYNEGEITLQQYFDVIQRLHKDHADKRIVIEEKYLEALKKFPEKNLEEIKAVEEKIKQIKIKSADDWLKIQKKLTEDIKKEYEDAFASWEAIEELKLQSLKSHLDLEDALEEAAAKEGLIRQSERLDGKLERLREYYQKEIDIADETLLRIAEIRGMESEEYQNAAMEREKLQTDLETNIIRSEANIKEARINEEREAQKFIADLTGEREDLAKLEAEEKLGILRDYYDQALITAREYTDAVAVVEKNLTEQIKDYTDERTEIVKGVVIATRDTMDKVKETLEEALDISLEGVYDRVTRIGRYMQNLFFPELRDAIRQAAAEIKDIMGELPDYLKDLANDVGSAVSATVFEYAQEVADYLIYVTDLLLDLQDLISSYKKQLYRLKGDKIALVEIWYEEEMAKLREKFKDLEHTAEYKEALRLIENLYKEKLEKAEEAMEKEEGLWAGLSETVAKSAGKIKNAIQESIPGLAEGEFHLGTSQEISITKEIKLDSFFQIQTFDSPTTVRWLKDTVFPEWEKHLKLKGVKL